MQHIGSKPSRSNGVSHWKCIVIHCSMVFTRRYMDYRHVLVGTRHTRYWVPKRPRQVRYRESTAGHDRASTAGHLSGAYECENTSNLDVSCKRFWPKKQFWKTKGASDVITGDWRAWPLGDTGSIYLAPYQYKTYAARIKSSNLWLAAPRSWAGSWSASQPPTKKKKRKGYYSVIYEAT